LHLGACWWPPSPVCWTTPDLRHRLGGQAFRVHKPRFTFAADMQRNHALWQIAAVAMS
jgi:hypothetical protein